MFLFGATGEILMPALDYGLLPGILRAELLRQSRCIEARLILGDLRAEVRESITPAGTRYLSFEDVMAPLSSLNQFQFFRSPPHRTLECSSSNQRY